MLNGEPLLANSSIRDFRGGVVGYMADTVKWALLLPGDMAELQDIKRHEVFLNLKRYLAMVRPLFISLLFSLFLFFLNCFLYFLFLNLDSILGRLFKLLSGWKR